MSGFYLASHTKTSSRHHTVVENLLDCRIKFHNSILYLFTYNMIKHINISPKPPFPLVDNNIQPHWVSGISRQKTARFISILSPLFDFDISFTARKAFAWAQLKLKFRLLLIPSTEKHFLLLNTRHATRRSSRDPGGL